MRAASLTYGSVWPLCSGDNEDGGMGSQISAPGQEALLTARLLGHQGTPQPRLAGRAHGLLLVFLRCLGEQVKGSSWAFQLEITTSVPLSLGVHPPISNHNKVYEELLSALLFLSIEL